MVALGPVHHEPGVQVVSLQPRRRDSGAIGNQLALTPERRGEIERLPNQRERFGLKPLDIVFARGSVKLQQELIE